MGVVDIVQKVRCPRGWVLSRDDRCWPKSMVSGRSHYRKWRTRPKPPFTAREWKVATGYKAVTEKLISATKGMGAYAAQNAPRPKAKPAAHHHHPGAGG